MKNKTIIIIVLLMIAVIVASIASNHFKVPQKEKATTVTEEKSNNPCVVSADKETFKNMSEHDFVSYVTPILETNYNSALYTTFDFKDGTGIYFPFSDISKSASYANLDSEGFPTTVIGTITINGQHVVYEELNGSYAPESKEIESYVDQSYINDYFCAAVKDDTIYVNIMTNVETELEAQNSALEFVRSLINNGYNSTANQYCISVDRKYLCVVSKNADSVELNQNLLDPALEILF